MHNWGRRIEVYPEPGYRGRAFVIREDASQRIYATDGSGTWTTQQAGDRNTLTEQRDATGARTGFQFKLWADDSIEHYDAAGRLLKVVQRNGWTHTLIYSDAATPAATAPRAGLLIAVRNHFGRELKFTYDAAARLVELLPPGAVSGTAPGSATSPIRYLHNEPAGLGSGVPALNQPTSVVWQDGAVRRYHYENAQFPQWLSGRSDELGVRIGTYTYNTSGQLVRSVGPGGTNAVEFVYLGSTTQVTDRSGAVPVTSTYTWETAAGVIRPTAVSVPCSQCGATSAGTAYTAGGEVARRVDHDGRITFYKYDAKGRETERATYPAAYNSATTRPALNLAESVVSTKWHATWNLPTQVAEPGKVTAYTYGSGGRLTGESWTASTDATGAAKFAAAKTGSTYATGYSYTTSHLAATIVTQETPEGGTTAAQTGRWTVTYKTDGGIKKVTDALSAASATVTSDSSGSITKIVAGNGAQATFTGNPHGYMIKAVTPQLTTDYDINGLGQTSEIRFSDGRWIRYGYNAAGRLVRISDNTGTVEQFAGIDARWFKDGGTIRAAARWLAWRGRQLGDLLVPEARAQAQLAIPAAAVLGLILIIENTRRNSAPAAPGGARSCCGPDGPPAPGGAAEESLASRWSRQVTMLLTGQPGSPSSPPQYDKAGLLISSKSCIAAPGYCDPNDYENMRSEVNNACKGQQRRCSVGLSRADLLTRIELNRSCAVARDKINKTCFAGGDREHRDQAIDAWSAVTRCEDILSKTP